MRLRDSPTGTDSDDNDGSDSSDSEAADLDDGDALGSTRTPFRSIAEDLRQARDLDSVTLSMHALTVGARCAPPTPKCEPIQSVIDQPARLSFPHQLASDSQPDRIEGCGMISCFSGRCSSSDFESSLASCWDHEDATTAPGIGTMASSADVASGLAEVTHRMLELSTQSSECTVDAFPVPEPCGFFDGYSCMRTGDDLAAMFEVASCYFGALLASNEPSLAPQPTASPSPPTSGPSQSTCSSNLGLETELPAALDMLERPKRVVRFASPEISTTSQQTQRTTSDLPEDHRYERLVDRAFVSVSPAATQTCKLPLEPSSWPLSESPANNVTINYDKWICDDLPERSRLVLRSEMSKPISDKDQDGYIYVFELRPDASVDSKNELKMYKIGRTRNPYRRFSQMEKKCGFTPKLIEFFPSPRPSQNFRGAVFTTELPRCRYANRTERLIHIELRERGFSPGHIGCPGACKEKHREWFRAPTDTCKDVVEPDPFQNIHIPVEDVTARRNRTEQDWAKIREVIVRWVEFMDATYGPCPPGVEAAQGSVSPSQARSPDAVPENRVADGSIGRVSEAKEGFR
ncbi:GIY-YIG nuclease family protein [Polychytrium aggregatum]|uniref:GIY-YIG nuclease family protein n=1 Tax=Polychytrium aggregatum TaxID=110093 RepID=UPI0022FDE531|nr:GIY-YIG nuclease family protein [Polychytrium aggregatum]KAI9208996.1 meiotically up-regulated gene 113-domain-containing protein [Polychytrium aggregatum]